MAQQAGRSHSLQQWRGKEAQESSIFSSQLGCRQTGRGEVKHTMMMGKCSVVFFRAGQKDAGPMGTQRENGSEWRRGQVRPLVGHGRRKWDGTSCNGFGFHIRAVHGQRRRCTRRAAGLKTLAGVAQRRRAVFFVGQAASP